MKLGTQSVTVLTAGTVADDYHNVMQDWTAASRLVVTGCSVQPGIGAQIVLDREAVTTLYTVWAPLGTPVIDTNRIEFLGTVYDIDGSVEHWAVGDRLDHLYFRLKAVAG